MSRWASGSNSIDRVLYTDQRAILNSQLLHTTADRTSPFDFDEYADDAAVLTEIHPLAVYRRLVEPYVRRRAAQHEEMKARAEAAGKTLNYKEMPGSEVLKVDYNAWKNCMEKWEKEVAVREKEGVSAGTCDDVESDN